MRPHRQHQAVVGQRLAFRQHNLLLFRIERHNRTTRLQMNPPFGIPLVRMDLEGISLDLEAIGESVKIVKQQRSLGAVVLNACPPPHRGGETAIVREAREALGVYGLPVSPVSVSQRAAFSHAFIDGRAVTEFDATGKAANEIRSLFEWIETRW